MLIDGRLVEGDRLLPVINPATEEVFATVARASEAQLDAAVAAARSAFRSWSVTDITQRRALVEKLADALRDDAAALARAVTQEQGKPLAEAQGEVAWAEAYLRHTATLSLPDRVIQHDDQFRIETRHRPLGVVAGIIAWNFPLLLCCWKIAPALIAGNTLVLKPAPTTPVSALLIAEKCREIFPPGVVNVIVDDNDLGPRLTDHPDVAKVAFTGSSATGKAIAATAARTMKRLTLEMGGNDAAIVLPDADISTTAARLYGGAFLNAGQVCLAIKRAYVHADIYDEMCGELARLASEAVVDDGLKQGVTMGPLQNKAQYDKVRSLLESARNDGTVLTGGVDDSRPGYFVKPAIVRDVSDGDRIVDEEQFGPILPVIKYTNVDDVIARANDSDYGLGGSVHSADVERAADIASRIEAGSVWVNQHIHIGPHIPMAGFKASGLGIEQSVEGLAEYTQMQVVNVALG